MKTAVVLLCMVGAWFSIYGQAALDDEQHKISLSRSTISLSFAPQVSWYSNSSAVGSITFSTGLTYTYYLSPGWQVQFPVQYIQQRGQDILVRCPFPPCTGLDIEKTGYTRLSFLMRRKISGTRNGQLFMKGGPFLQGLVQHQPEVNKYASLLFGVSMAGEFTYQVLPLMDVGIGVRVDCALSDAENPDAIDAAGEPFYQPGKSKAVSSNVALEIGLTWLFRRKATSS